ncbi:hypothetical protein PR048_025376 [Dryococelus australis]|uniref:Reverse transcriptase Ty1/copia-type domain-containing protein n=1 Tax=Dryococelus australis TaxID=614101 RepID=A0ABQ9GR47_9NEOP|nr:hypothetical protein PR048_025376 [Dryococelus australis]
MLVPEGFEDVQGSVVKLNKSLYGLKKAPRAWNKRFVDFRNAHGLYQLITDKSVFVNDEGNLILAIWVDDGLVISNENKIDVFMMKLQTEFEGFEGCLRTRYSALKEAKRDEDGAGIKYKGEETQCSEKSRRHKDTRAAIRKASCRDRDSHCQALVKQESPLPQPSEAEGRGERELAAQHEGQSRASTKWCAKWRQTDAQLSSRQFVCCFIIPNEPDRRAEWIRVVPGKTEPLRAAQWYRCHFEGGSFQLKTAMPLPARESGHVAVCHADMKAIQSSSRGLPTCDAGRDGHHYRLAVPTAVTRQYFISFRDTSQTQDARWVRCSIIRGDARAHTPPACPSRVVGNERGPVGLVGFLALPRDP